MGWIQNTYTIYMLYTIYMSSVYVYEGTAEPCNTFIIVVVEILFMSEANRFIL